MAANSFGTDRPNDGGGNAAVIGERHRLNELQAIGSQHRLLQLNLPDASFVTLPGVDLSDRIPLHFDILAQPSGSHELKLGTTGLPHLEIHLTHIRHRAITDADHRGHVRTESRRSRGQTQLQSFRRCVIAKGIAGSRTGCGTQRAVECGWRNGLRTAITDQDRFQVVVEIDSQLPALGVDIVNRDPGHDILGLAGIAHQRTADGHFHAADRRCVQVHRQPLAVGLAIDEPIGAGWNAHLGHSQGSRQPQSQSRRWARPTPSTSSRLRIVASRAETATAVRASTSTRDLCRST